MKWRQKEEDIASMSDKQFRILNSASKLVKPGGLIVYGTCSLLRDENECVVERFMADYPGKFELVNAAEALATDGIDPDSSPYLRLLPNIHGCDGFFSAVLKAL